MIEISGFEELQRELEDAQKALESIDGELTSVSFDPEDPLSIENAIQHINTVIDQRLEQYSSNEIVGSLIDEMKEQYRQGILDKAAEARLGGIEDDA